jgi:hypothetical protein
MDEIRIESTWPGHCHRDTRLVGRGVLGVPASGRISQATKEKECGLSTRPIPKALWRFFANSTKTVFGVKSDTGHAVDLLTLAFSIDEATPTASDSRCSWSLWLLPTRLTLRAPTPQRLRWTRWPALESRRRSQRPRTGGADCPHCLRALRRGPVQVHVQGELPARRDPDFAVGVGFAVRVTNPTGN